MKTTNIFNDIPKELSEELFQTLISNETINIQKIVSEGQVTPDGEWYNQDKAEWVIVLQGNAIITFENEQIVKLGLGDYINIPAHKKHRVSWTDKNEKTVWLAVHY